ncbi:MAG: hypothetical protein ACUVVU_03215 [Tepidimonas sp.]
MFGTPQHGWSCDGARFMPPPAKQALEKPAGILRIGCGMMA